MYEFDDRSPGKRSTFSVYFISKRHSSTCKRDWARKIRVIGSYKTNGPGTLDRKPGRSRQLVEKLKCNVTAKEERHVRSTRRVVDNGFASVNKYCITGVRAGATSFRTGYVRVYGDADCVFRTRVVHMAAFANLQTIPRESTVGHL